MAEKNKSSSYGNEDKRKEIRDTEADTKNKTCEEKQNIMSEVMTWLNNSEYFREKLSENPKTPPEILDKLADDKTDTIRIKVARNPNTEQKTLIQL